MKSWKDLLNEVLESGFEIILYRRDRVEKNCTVRYPSFLVAAHRDKKLLLLATSYVPQAGPEELGTIRIYGTLERKDPSEWLSFATYSSYSKNSRAEFSIDRIDALSALTYVERQGTFVDWHDESRFVWFLTHEQEEMKDPTLRERLWKEFLETAPDWVQAFIR